jgi:hypothetical protein
MKLGQAAVGRRQDLPEAGPPAAEPAGLNENNENMGLSGERGRHHQSEGGEGRRLSWMWG